jgi:hypothetical protein
MRWQQQQNAVKLGDEGKKFQKNQKKNQNQPIYCKLQLGKNKKPVLLIQNPQQKKRAEIA